MGSLHYVRVCMSRFMYILLLKHRISVGVVGNLSLRILLKHFGKMTLMIGMHASGYNYRKLLHHEYLDCSNTRNTNFSSLERPDIVYFSIQIWRKNWEQVIQFIKIIGLWPAIVSCGLHHYCCHCQFNVCCRMWKSSLRIVREQHHLHSLLPAVRTASRTVCSWVPVRPAVRHWDHRTVCQSTSVPPA